MNTELYRRAQIAVVELKACVRDALAAAGKDGLTNAEVGRSLGIYAGHVGHEGHVSRTLLGMLEAEGVAQQDEASKRWTLASFPSGSEAGRRSAQP